MQYCEHCKVDIKGSHLVCPLCSGIIEQKDEGQSENVFPQIPTIYQEFNGFIRILLMISIAATVISFAVNIIVTPEARWSILVAAGIFCMWIMLFFIIRNKNNIPKTIIWQVGLISIFSVIWDASLGWVGWSIDYVIPFVCLGAILVLEVAAKLLKIWVKDFIIYLLIDGLFGFIPIIFILFGWLNVLYPSIICVAASAISLSGLIIFEGDSMKSELDKRMHI